MFNNASFTDVRMDNVRFESCEFKGTTLFNNIDFKSVTFSTGKQQKGGSTPWESTILDNSQFTNIQNLKFYNFSVQNCMFNEVDFSTLNISDSKNMIDFSGSTFTSCSMKGADLRKCKLQKATFFAAKLADAKLNNIDLTDSKFTEQTDLTGADFTKATLNNANLSGSNLTNATLNGTILTGTNLSSTILTGAVLTKADFTKANLKESTFDSDTKIDSTIFNECTFLKADINGLQRLNLTNGLIFNKTKYTKMVTFLMEAGWIEAPCPSIVVATDNYTYKVITANGFGIHPVPSKTGKDTMGLPVSDVDFSHSYIIWENFTAPVAASNAYFENCKFDNATITAIDADILQPSFIDCNFDQTWFSAYGKGKFELLTFIGSTTGLSTGSFDPSAQCISMIKCTSAQYNEPVAPAFHPYCLIKGKLSSGSCGTCFEKISQGVSEDENNIVFSWMIVIKNFLRSIKLRIKKHWSSFKFR